MGGTDTRATVADGLAVIVVSDGRLGSAEDDGTY